MKKKLLFYIGFLLVAYPFLLDGFAQDYTQWRLPQGAKMRLGKGRINDIKFSPDDTQLAVATSIGVWLYDAQTGAEIALLKVRRVGHRWANTLAFSPDGKTLASGIWKYSGPIQLWDVATGEKFSTLEGEIGAIKALTFSADGSQLFCAHSPRDAKLSAWEIASGRQIVNFSGSQNSRNGSNAPLVMSQDTRLIAGASVNIVKIWEVHKKKLQHTLKEDDGVYHPSGAAQSLAFSPDGKTLAAGKEIVRLWDIETGDELTKFPKQPRFVGALAFSPNGKILAAGDYAGAIFLWNLPARDQLSPVSITGHNTLPITSFAFTKDSKTLASGSQDSTIRLWDVATKNQQLVIPGHTGIVEELQFLEDGKTIFSCGADGTFRYYDTVNSTERLIPTKQKWYVRAFALSKNGKMMASGGVDGLVRLWDAESHTEIATLKGHTYGSVFRHLQFSEDGKTLGSVSFRGEVILWDVPNRKLLSLFEVDDSDNVRPSTFAFTPDLKKFAYTLWGGKIQLWDLNADKVYSLIKDLSIKSIYKNKDFRALTFSPDGRTLASGDWHGAIQLWDVDTRQHIADFIDARGTIESLRFSPDGKTVAKGGVSGSVELWDVETKSRIWYNHSAHADSVTHFAFTPDGKTLVSGSTDGTILVWDLNHIKHIRKR